ncbi:MAG: PilZ domain-containing protein [Candidatus Zapsychrus exili]|nr:PilZ domain-containing protein [Candidatus Zapsychrus exili]
MNNHSGVVLNDARTNLRIQEKSRIKWYLHDSDLNGSARVHNISSSGMLIETDSDLTPADNSVFSFEPLSKKGDYIPDRGKIVWHKSKRFKKNNNICGIEFFDVKEDVSSKLFKRIQSGMNRLKRIKMARMLFSALLFLAIVSLTVYILWLGGEIYKNVSKSSSKMLGVTIKQASLTQNYSELYQKSQVKLVGMTSELSSTKGVLSSVAQDLSAAKKALLETETLLLSAQDNNSKLSKDFENFKIRSDEMKTEFTKKIASLEETESQINYEMIILQNQLRYYSGDVDNIEEAKELTSIFKQRMKLVKRKIKNFKREANRAKTAAFKERDMIKSLLGNNGYFVKNGQNVEVDIEKYNALDSGKSMNSKGKVNINVDFFKK